MQHLSASFVGSDARSENDKPARGTGRVFEFHLPPSGMDVVGDEEVWDVLLMEGQEVPGHPDAFFCFDRVLHQPTFLPGACGPKSLHSTYG